MQNNGWFIGLILVVFVFGCKSEPAKQHAHIAAIDSLIQKEIDADHFPGAVIQVKKGNEILHRSVYGYAQKYAYDMQLLERPELMTDDHLFDLASLTKVCATTLGIMKLVDEDVVRLDDPIHYHLPEFKKDKKDSITVRHLLTHTSGLAQWVPTYYHASSRKERYRYVSQLPLKWEVGSGRHYSDLGFMILGDIIEKVSRQRLNKYLEETLYAPLGLQFTTFNPKEKGLDQFAATSHGNPFEKRMVYDDDFGYRVEVDPHSWDGWREYTLRGEVNDGNAWYANGGVAGHAGLFSTVSELQVLVDLLINEGRFQGNQLLSSAVIDTFLTKDEYGNGLGWAMDTDIFSAKGAPEGTFGHTGFTGTSIVVVPQDSLSIVLLTNRQNAGPQQNGYYFDLGPLRQAVFTEVSRFLSTN